MGAAASLCFMKYESLLVSNNNSLKGFRLMSLCVTQPAGPGVAEVVGLLAAWCARNWIGKEV